MMQKNELTLIYEALLLSSPAVCGQSDSMISQEKERHRAAIALARAALAPPEYSVAGYCKKIEELIVERDDLRAALAQPDHIGDVNKLVTKEVSLPKPHWYCVDKSGMATLCADQDDALQNAKMGALDWPNNAPYRAVQLCEYQPEQEPVAAAKKDEVFAASIEFIGALTGTTPPPIETAPPEVFKPFRDFTENVCSIFATTPPKRQTLTQEQAMDLLPTNASMSRTDALLWVLRATERAHGIQETKT